MTTEINPFQAPQARVLDRDESTTKAKIFSASGRLNRVRYMAYSTGMSILVMAAAGAITVGLARISPLLGMVGEALLMVAYIYILILQITLAMQRCHDFNASGWLALFVIVPFAALLFWLIPGTAGENKYGAPNPPNTTLVVLGALVLPLFFVIGILAAIAIPQYAEYTKRAKAAQMRQAAPPITQPAPAGER